MLIHDMDSTTVLDAVAKHQERTESASVKCAFGEKDLGVSRYRGGAWCGWDWLRFLKAGLRRLWMPRIMIALPWALWKRDGIKMGPVI